MTAPHTGHWTDEPCIDGPGKPVAGGYKKMTIGGVRKKAHQWSYIQAYGPVPDGLEIDHLCRNPACMNPKHLEAVTHRVNVLRSNAPTAQRARQTHCRHGHELSGDNLYLDPTTGYRKCRACGRRRADAKRRTRTIPERAKRGAYRQKEAKNARS